MRLVAGLPSPHELRLPRHQGKAAKVTRAHALHNPCAITAHALPYPASRPLALMLRKDDRVGRMYAGLHTLCMLEKYGCI